MNEPPPIPIMEETIPIATPLPKRVRNSIA
jgi:hypothetical protein